MTDQEKRNLDIKLARHFYPIKEIHYNDWDTEKLDPLYIPSGKPWRTHMIDARPIPRLTESLDACFKCLVAKFSDEATLDRLVFHKPTGKADWWVRLVARHQVMIEHGPSPALALCLAIDRLIDTPK